MSKRKDTEQEHEMQNHLQELDSEHDEDLEKIANELEAQVIENPEILRRVLDRPEVKVAIARESFRGPVPPPRMLSEYDQIVPGLADRLVKLTEDEQKHRHKISSTALRFSYWKDKRGQWMGFLLSASILSMGLYFASQGKDGLAGTVITANLVGLASVFVIGRLRAKSGNDD